MPCLRRMTDGRLHSQPVRRSDPTWMVVLTHCFATEVTFCGKQLQEGYWDGLPIKKWQASHHPLAAGPPLDFDS